MRETRARLYFEDRTKTVLPPTSGIFWLNRIHEVKLTKPLQLPHAIWTNFQVILRSQKAKQKKNMTLTSTHFALCTLMFQGSVGQVCKTPAEEKNGYKFDNYYSVHLPQTYPLSWVQFVNKVVYFYSWAFPTIIFLMKV